LGRVSSEATCAACGRTILDGERVHHYVSAEGRQEVCELCSGRAAEFGWLPADQEGAEEKLRAEAERKSGFLARLFARPEGEERAVADAPEGDPADLPAPVPHGPSADLPAPIAGEAIAAGKLVHVLEPYAPMTPGMFLYHPGKRQMMPKLRAFIDHVKGRAATVSGH